MRRFLLISFSIVLGTIAVIIFVPTIFKDQIASVLSSELNHGVDADVTFSDADVNLWRNFPQITVTLNDFVIAGKREFSGDTLIRAQELHLVLNTLKLIIHDGIEINHLSLQSPDILIVDLSAGKSNYDIVLSDSTDSSDDVVIDIESWEISEGRLRYNDHDNKINLLAQDVDLNGELSVHGAVTHFSIFGTTTAFWASHENQNYIGEKEIAVSLDAAWNAKKHTVSFKNNLIRVNNLNLAFSGALAFLKEDLNIDLKVKSTEAEFKDILSLSQKLFKDFKRMEIQGKMALDAEFLGIYNSKEDLFPAFKAHLVVQEGSMKYHALPSSINQINFDLAAYNTDGKPENTVIDLQYFGMNVGENPVFGSAKIDRFRDGSLSADMMAKFPLAELAAVYPIDGLVLGGDLDFKLNANGPYTGRLSGIFSPADWKASRVPAFNLDVNLSQGNIQYTNLAESIKDLFLEFHASNKSGVVDDTQLKIEKLQGLMGDNPIRGRMSVTGFSEPLIDASLKATLHLDEIKDFYPMDDLTLNGVVDIDVLVDGNLSAQKQLFPKISANVNLRDGFIQSNLYPAPMENTHLVLKAINKTGKFADTRLIIDTLTYSIEGEPFVVNGFIEDLNKYAYDFDIKGIVYLEKVKRILSLEDITMQGEIDIDVRAAGNLNDLKAGKYHRLPTEGQIKFRDVVFKNESIPHVLNVREGHLFLSNDKIFIDTLHGSLGESNFQLTGHLYNYLSYFLHSDEEIKGELLFESDNFNVNELLQESHEYRDTVHHDLAIIRMPNNIDFTFDSKIGRLSYKNLSLKNLNGEIVVRNGMLSLNKTTFDALDAGFAISGEYDPRDLKHPKFDLEVSIRELDINKAHEAFVSVQAIAPAAEHTYGIFSIDYKLRGELSKNMHPAFESLKGDGIVRIRDAEVNGMKLFHHISGLTKKEELMNPKLKDIVMDLNVENGVVYVKPFSMKLAGFDTEITGKHELTGTMSYVLKIALPPFDLVKIPLHVDGTYDNPRVRIGKGHEEALRKATGQLN
jgi:AsmA protein